MAKVVVVTSGKGGVGKSTFAVNLACAIAQLLAAKGRPGRVGLMDCDIYGPSVPLMIGLSGRPEIEGDFLIPMEAHGVKVMSMGFLIDDNTPVVWRGPMIMKTVQQFVQNVRWGELDYLLIDLPPGTGDIHLSLVQTVPLDGVVIVSTPQEVALADARKGVNMFKLDTINIPIVGLVENMAWFTPAELPENRYYIFGRDGVKNLAAGMNETFLGHIPLVQSVRESGDAGRPAVFQENTPTATAFEELVGIFVKEVEAIKARKAVKA